ncbi:DEAD/DEAH box helicase [Devosia sp.]|uniref:DEAD/DEAH box helicase n=1 Tax=Devosia sp. TaxID=1871048 RepID=UPI002AFEAA8C|nr:DEAD/DEAH box helicase [Devosia sp.]
MRPLREHQSEAIRLLRLSLAKGNKRPMLQAPTGFGKTLLGAAITQMALDKGNRVCFTVPAVSLIDQTVEAFRAEGITDIGVIQADHPGTDSMARVQVASVQTLSRRMFPGTDLVIVDEAHQAYKTVFQWMANNPKLPFVGLSATPWTKGLGKHYDDLIIAATTADLIERGYLSKFRVYAPTHPDLTGVRTRAGDYAEDDLAEAMSKPQLTADIVSTWMRLGENRPTLCFAVNRAHAKFLKEEFERAGARTGYVDAYTTRDERQQLAEDFQAGRVKVVVNVGVLTTGVDWDVRCLILARPTKSEILFTQIIGRALRTAEGKADALILDHSDTTLRLGFVTDIHHETLDTGRKKESSSGQRAKPVKAPKECPSCAYLKPAGVHACPSCGFAPEKIEEVETIEGELAQVKGKPKTFDKATKQRWWSGLLWYVDTRGKSRGWASHTYKDKFGVWPRDLFDHAIEPDGEVRNFVKHKAIRWAKGQAKKQEQAHAA